MGRSKVNVIVVTKRPELRFVLRIEGNVNLRTAETMHEFMDRLTAAGPGQIIILDRAQSPGLVREAAKHLRLYPGLFRTILIGKSCRDYSEDEWSQVVLDGMGCYERLLNSLHIMAASRKPGPLKKGVSSVYASFREAIGTQV